MASINVRKLLDRAQKNYGNQKWSKALEDYLTIVKVPTEARNPKIQHKIADIHVKMGDKAKAVAAYQKTVKLYMSKGFLLQAISVCKQAKALDPNNEDIEKELTELYARRGGGQAPARRPAHVSAAPPTPKQEAPAPAAAAPPPAAQVDDEPETTGEIAEDMFEDTMPSIDFSEPEEEPAAPELVVEEPEPVPIEAEPEDDAVEIVDEAEPPADDDGAAISIDIGDDESLEELMKEAAASVDDGNDSEPDEIPGVINVGDDGIDLDAGGIDIDISSEDMPEELPVEEPEPEAGDEDVDIEVESDGIDIDIMADDVSENVVEEPSAEPVDAGGQDLLVDEIVEIDDDAGPISGEDLLELDVLDEIPLFPDIPLFSDLSTDEFDKVVKMLQSAKIEAGERFINEGDPGNSLFIISIGEVEVLKKVGNKEISITKLHDGDFFGEFGFFSGSKRQASVVATSDTDLMEIMKEDMDSITREYPSIKEKLNKLYIERVLENLLLTSALFRPLDQSSRKNLASVFEYERKDPGTQIITEGDEGDCMYVIQAGNVKVHTTDPMGDEVELATLVPGDFFGEMSLLQGNPRTANVTAVTEVELMRLNKDGLDDLLEKYPEIEEVLLKTAEERSAEVVNKVSFLDLDEDDFEAGSLL